jgi:Holliday junction resolvasome RuvABC endonuclease subunit
MRVLALDMGEKAGYAIFEDECLLISGTTTFQFTQGIGWRTFKTFLMELHNKYQLDIVVYEEPMFNPMKPAAAPALYKYIGGLTMVVMDMIRVPCQGIPLGKIKHIVGGSVKATKDQVRSVVNKTLSASITDPDEADATAVGLVYLTEFYANEGNKPVSKVKLKIKLKKDGTPCKKQPKPARDKSKKYRVEG